MDGGIYYDGDSAVAAVLTSTGMTFYERQGRSFNTADKHYISLSDLSRSRGLAISVSGEEGYTEQQEAPEPVSYTHLGKTSKLMEVSMHIESLSEVLRLLQGENEVLFNVNTFVTVDDYERSQQ